VIAHVSSTESRLIFKSSIIPVLSNPNADDDHEESDRDNGRDLFGANNKRTNQAKEGKPSKKFTIFKIMFCPWLSNVKQTRAATNVNEYRRLESMTTDSNGRSWLFVTRTLEVCRSIVQRRYANKRVDSKFVKSEVA
jgi:hypothetical protein